MDMEFDYDWNLSKPGKVLKVHLANRKPHQRVFDATMLLHRRPLTRGQIASTWLRFPWMTAQVVSAIYYEAFRLWIKKCPYHPYPQEHDRA
jgi:DUF1365 family protein